MTTEMSTGTLSNVCVREIILKIAEKCQSRARSYRFGKPLEEHPLDGQLSGLQKPLYYGGTSSAPLPLCARPRMFRTSYWLTSPRSAALRRN